MPSGETSSISSNPDHVKETTNLLYPKWSTVACRRSNFAMTLGLIVIVQGSISQR